MKKILEDAVLALAAGLSVCQTPRNRGSAEAEHAATQIRFALERLRGAADRADGFLTQLEMDEPTTKEAERMASRLGYEQTAYTSTSALIGLHCLPERLGRAKRGGCLVNTVELGLLFVQTQENITGQA